MNEICKVQELKENTISSREVAEMMGVRHDHLLNKIDEINKYLSPENLGNKYLATEN